MTEAKMLMSEPEETETSNRFDKVFSLTSIFIIISILTVISLMEMNFFRLFARTKLSSIGEFFSFYFLPPETSPRVNESIQYALLETLQMALVGTYFGIFLSFPLSIMAANNLWPRYIHIPARILLSSIRTVPSLIWALLAVISFGLGPRSGVIAIAIYTIGYLGKFQYETFEGISSESIEALTALGAKKLQIIRFVVFPETANQLISQIIFMFEYNVRASSIIGFVGAGGIGFLLNIYIGFFEFRALFTALMYMLVVVIIIDFLGARIRRRFQDPNFQELNV